MKKNILIICAHPDDEVIGCGGTIAKFSKENHSVTVLILGEGKASRYRRKSKRLTREIQLLRKESKLAHKYLGVKKTIFYDFPDNKFDCVALLDLVRVIERAVKEFRPTIIFTHHEGDLNIDHQMTHRAVITATRPLKGVPVKEIYTFEVASSTEWNYISGHTSFTPNLFIDITETMEIKLKAMQAYKSELELFPHPRSVEYLRLQSKFYGAGVAMPFCERFMIIREMR